jgi:ParB family chromosome partitioning protein
MPIDRIRPDPNQPRKRIADDHLKQLVASIKRVGILQPITLQYIEEDDMYQILSGECRFTAAKDAGLEFVPVWVKSPKNEEVLLHQVIENWHRSDLNPFDLADSLAQRKDANGLSQSDLARSTGKNKSEISRLLSLLELDADVQKIARSDTSGRFTKRHLFSVARLESEGQQKLVRRIEKDNLSALDVERIVARQERPQLTATSAGAPWTRHTYRTPHATVTLTFRKRDVTNADVLVALDELRKQLSGNDRN